MRAVGPTIGPYPKIREPGSIDARDSPGIFFREGGLLERGSRRAALDRFPEAPEGQSGRVARAARIAIAMVVIVASRFLADDRQSTITRAHLHQK